MIYYPSLLVCIPIDKIKNYLLKPGTKHFLEFKNAGYMPSDDVKLFHDIEAQFNKGKAEGFRYDAERVSYSIIMELGTVTKYPFLTAWAEDAATPLPRFITAYRVKRK